MKVAFVTTYDAADIAASSRTGYYMGQALKEQLDVSYVGPLTTKQGLPLRIKAAIRRACQHGSYDPSRDASVLRHYARQAAKKLATSDADFVLSPGTDAIAYLECRQPIVLWWDALFAGWMRVNEGIARFSNATVRDGHRMEREALSRCSLAIFSSEWAARTAIDDYGMDSRKVHIIPFGPNLDCDESKEIVHEQIRAKNLDRLNLLFVSGDWKNKRGDTVVEVGELLNRRNVPTTVTIVGCSPPDAAALPPFVRLTGFLEKSVPEDARRLKKLYAEAHFFLLPTARDCSPVVISEANAFGVPVLSTRVAGIPSLITPDVNGALFSKGEPAAAFVEYILDRIARPQRYRELALSSYREYEARFKWSGRIDQLKELTAPLLG